MITYILYFSMFEKENCILMCLGNAERCSDSKNVISTFKNGLHCIFLFFHLPQICSLNWTVTATPWELGQAA